MNKDRKSTGFWKGMMRLRRVKGYGTKHAVERERERESSTHSERGRGQIDGREQGESKMVTLVKETSAIFVLTKNGMASKSQPNTPQTPFSQWPVSHLRRSSLRLHVTHCATHSIGHGIQHRVSLNCTPTPIHLLFTISLSTVFLYGRKVGFFFFLSCPVKINYVK